jgi:hypothetical protein
MIKASNNPFPHDPYGPWQQMLPNGGYEGTAQDLKNEINELALPDAVLVKGAITKTGNELSISALAFTCRIDQEEYTNPNSYSATIAEATEGYHRIDILVFTKFSTIVKIQGTEGIESAKEPDTPEDTIKIGFISIFGDNIYDPIVVIDGVAYVEKLESAEWIVRGSYAHIQFSIPYYSSLRFTGSTVTLPGVYLFPEYKAYSGKRLTVKNFQTTDIVIKHLSSVVEPNINTKFWFPTLTDFILKPGQIIEFSLSLVSNRFEFISVASTVTGAMIYKGSVANYASLPSSGVEIGWMYNVTDTGHNYVWSGTVWDDLGPAVDVSGKEDVLNKTNTIAGNEASTSLYASIKGIVDWLTSSKIKSILGQATSTVGGWLSSTDWNIFNNKQNALYVSPNNFTGTDTSKIQQAVNYANTNNLQVLIPKKDSSNTPWDIESAILLKSNTTIIIDGAILKLTDTSRDNMFRTENCGLGITGSFTILENIHIKGLNGAKCKGADNPRATGDNGKTLAITGESTFSKSYGTDAGVSGQTQTGDWRNYMFLFAYTNNYSIEGIEFINAHAYSVSSERCSFGRFKTLKVQAPLVRTIAGGTHYVKNTTLLDFRFGCNNMIVQDITGFSEDDALAVVMSTASETAGLYGTYQVTGNVYGGTTDNVHDFIFKDIAVSCNNNHIRLFNYAGTKLYNISIQNVTDKNTSNMSIGCVVRIGDSLYGGASALGETYNINIYNVVNNTMPYAINIGGSLSESQICNINDNSTINTNYPISVNNNGTRNVQLNNIFKYNCNIGMSVFMNGSTGVKSGLRVDKTSKKLELYDELRGVGGEIIVKNTQSPTDIKLFWSGTQVQYDAIVTKDIYTIYIIVG